MTPLIAITGNYSSGTCTMLEGYFASIAAAGGSPVIVPPYADEVLMDALLDRVDAIVFSGGGDIEPRLLGQEPLPEVGEPNRPRDAQELPLMRKAVARQLPVLGICRGVQVMAAALGGTLHQDIYVQAHATLTHSQDAPRHVATHAVTVAPDSLLASLLLTPQQRQQGDSTLAVNSFHPQAVATPPDGFRVTAVAPDGIIEAIESTQHLSLLGVQFHPECFILGDDTRMMPLFQWLVQQGELYARTRHVHQHHVVLDSHCDTPMFFHQGVDFLSRDPRILVSLPAMRDGMQDCTAMVAYLPQPRHALSDGRWGGTEAADGDGFALANSLLDGIDDIVRRSHGQVLLANTADDVRRAKAAGVRCILPAIENGYALGTDLTRLDHFARRGIVYLTLCHNGNNALAASARPRDVEPLYTHAGLSALGEQAVRRMNDLGIMVDLSHAAPRTFYDALRVSRTPILCSHSSCRALCDHPRNLDDAQLAALAASGGLVQICLYGGFLRPESQGPATVHDAVRHILHAIAVCGIDHVGIGTDFDGDGGIQGCCGSHQLPNLTRHLLAAGLDETQLAALWGGNFLRLLTRVQDYAEHGNKG